jgi:hypothetical protein
MCDQSVVLPSRLPTDDRCRAVVHRDNTKVSCLIPFSFGWLARRFLKTHPYLASIFVLLYPKLGKIENAIFRRPIVEPSILGVSKGNHIRQSQQEQQGRN